MAEALPPTPASTDEGEKKKPTCVIVLGMAGSGKTSLIQRLVSHLHTTGRPPYVINLDPACMECPYPANVDIRYKHIRPLF